MLQQRRYRQRQAMRAWGNLLDDDLIDPADAIEAINRALNEWDLSIREVARLTGLPHDTISMIRRGKRKRITRRISNTIIRSLQNEHSRAIQENTRVPAQWSAQMVRSLIAQGWTMQHQRDILQNNLGISAGFIPSIGRGTNQMCYARHEENVKWLVRAIGDASGPSLRSMTIMKNRGVFPTKHYNLKGELIVSTLSVEQRASYKRVRS